MIRSLYDKIEPFSTPKFVVNLTLNHAPNNPTLLESKCPILILSNCRAAGFKASLNISCHFGTFRQDFGCNLNIVIFSLTC